ncbi:eukaryotic translation initiation factor 4 gamma 1-like [Amia ocellicauda]|uniref:eukaryotic translation initiation factor 4 gamma 1-like n=1 Tax=Amia ocellicauda TaxID=2972642 RepID=UPI003463D1DB
MDTDIVTSASTKESHTPRSGRPATGTLNLQQSSSAVPFSVHSDARRVLQRSSSCRGRSERHNHFEFLERSERRYRFECLQRRECSQRDRFERRNAQDKRGLVRSDRNTPPITKRGYSKETEDCGPADPLPRVASMTDNRDQGSREKAGSKETVKREAVSTPPPATAKATLSEDGMDKKSKAIIEEYLHINDMKEALQCVQELNSEPLLFVFVRNGIESSLERSTIARERMGLLLYQLLKAGTLPTEQYYKGLQEILEVAEDMSIDIPYIWQYLAEIIAPMLHEGGIAMGELFKEVSKPLIPLGKAGILLVKILSLLCKGMSHEKAGALWKDAKLVWKDILPEVDDVNTFVTKMASFKN